MSESRVRVMFDARMDAETKAKWIEGLRSGRYKQGKGLLRSLGNEFCCMGVLYDVLGLPWKEDPAVSCYIAGDSSQAYLPMQLRDQLGISGSVESDLAANNDHGDTFEVIADKIESTL